MANIDTELNAIKTAIYGKDVRDSIHDAIEKINEEVEAADETMEEFVQGNLDTSLESTTLPAQGKAVGDAIANIHIDVDDTLTEAGEAADAKKTGDEISGLKNAIVSYLEQIRDALEGGDIPGAIAILDQAILDLSTLG